MRFIQQVPTRYVFALLLRFLLAAPGALAQQTGSFQELPTFLQVGDEVRITEVSGVTTQGKILKLSDSSLRLTGFVRDLSSRQVSQVERVTTDSLADGIAAGALVGTASGAALLVAVCSSKFRSLPKSFWWHRSNAGHLFSDRCRHRGFNRRWCRED